MGFYSDRIYPILLRRAVRPFEEDRGPLLENARGRVLEIGIGGGQNLTRYPAGVDEVVCLESHGPLIREARDSLPLDWLGGGNGIRYSFHLARAEELPFRDSVFDCVVSFLLFCSLLDPRAAAAEAFRVLRPQGTLLFFEHVRSRAAGARLAQDLFNPLWHRLSCGCNLNRDTKGVFQEAGFEFLELEEGPLQEASALTLPKIKGIAVRPG